MRCKLRVRTAWVAVCALFAAVGSPAGGQQSYTWQFCPSRCRGWEALTLIARIYQKEWGWHHTAEWHITTLQDKVNDMGERPVAVWGNFRHNTCSARLQRIRRSLQMRSALK